MTKYLDEIFEYVDSTIYNLFTTSSNFSVFFMFDIFSFGVSYFGVFFRCFSCSTFFLPVFFLLAFLFRSFLYIPRDIPIQPGFLVISYCMLSYIITLMFFVDVREPNILPFLLSLHILTKSYIS